MNSKPARTAEDAPAEIARARGVIDEEIAGLKAMRDGIGAEFIAAINAIVACEGRLAISGMGKSGVVAQKIAGTLTSTGTPCFFVHPVEAGHGDLGLLSDGDVVIIISKSGGSNELRDFIDPLKRMDVTIIAMTAERDSLLGKSADVVLDIKVTSEAGSLGLAPTTSSTASLVMGDALASALMERRGFTAEDFARFHPSGVLGKRLTLTVGDVMRTGKDLPLVDESMSLRDALLEIMDKSIGCTGVVDSDGVLVGIITDGDLKRIMSGRDDALTSPVREVMTANPRTVDIDVLAVDALADMELNQPGPLLMLFIVDQAGKPTGLLHIHDILRAGLKA